MSNPKLYQSGNSFLSARKHLAAFTDRRSSDFKHQARDETVTFFRESGRNRDEPCSHPYPNVIAVPCSDWLAATQSAQRLSSSHGDLSSH
jgi:hypothetical protein